MRRIDTAGDCFLPRAVCQIPRQNITATMISVGLGTALVIGGVPPHANENRSRRASVDPRPFLAAVKPDLLAAHEQVPVLRRPLEHRR